MVPRSMEESSIETIFNEGYNKILYLRLLEFKYFLLEILGLAQENGVLKAKITHKLGTYLPKEYSDDLSLETETTKDPVQDILDECDEDDFGGFEELDGDLY